MNPAEKYMSQVSQDDSDIRFVPPSFMESNIYDSFLSRSENRSLDLFPSETGLPELCYYSDNPNDAFNRGDNYNIVNDTIPSTFDVLRNLDLDLNESEDLERAKSENDVDKIYSKIERTHPGIFATFYSYRIPRPIVKVVVKRLIRLTLAYCDKDYKHK